MSKGGRHGGGGSSLGCLFGSGERPSDFSVTPQVTKASWEGDDNSSRKPPKVPPRKGDVSNNYPRSQGQNLGNFINGRPTTKVNSPPGGDSSLGYLFGNK